MHRVLSRSQSRELDRHAIESCNVPGLVLMENAGRGAAEVIETLLPSGDPVVVIVCGTGNNGGDGFVVARHLASHGVAVGVWLVGSLDKVTGDARINLLAWRGLGGLVSVISSEEQRDELDQSLEQADVIVDALFGTGLDRDLAGLHAAVVDAINQAPAHRVALDLPSGLDANTGRVLGVAVQAQDTVTFGALKLGLVTPNGAALGGHVHVAGLGVPTSMIDHAGWSAEVILRSHVASLLTPRGARTHKHAEGSVLAFAGDSGKLGAALLVAVAALRGGAGLATIASWPEAVRALDQRVLEVMTTALDPEHVEDSVDRALLGRRAVAAGPGFGVDGRARQVVERVVLGWDGPKVVDADALTLFVGSADKLAKAKGSVVLTPHAGEMARLLGMQSKDVEADRAFL